MAVLYFIHSTYPIIRLIYVPIICLNRIAISDTDTAVGVLCLQSNYSRSRRHLVGRYLAIVFQDHGLRYWHSLELLTQKQHTHTHTLITKKQFKREKHWKPTRSTHFCQTESDFWKSESQFGRRAIEASIHPLVYAIKTIDIFNTERKTWQRKKHLLVQNEA